MSVPALFNWLAEALERHSSLTRLEARGALRLTLQEREAEAKALTVAQALDLLGGPLPRDLEGRGIKNAAALCRRILGELEAAYPEAARTLPVAAAVAVPPGVPASLFDWTADALERYSNLNRLNARGTLRLALKDGGFPAELVTREQMAAVLAHVMPDHLRRRGVTDADAVCRRMAEALSNAEILEPIPLHETPGEVFLRLGRV